MGIDFFGLVFKYYCLVSCCVYVCVCMCASAKMFLLLQGHKNKPISMVLPDCCKICPNESSSVIQDMSCLTEGLLFSPQTYNIKGGKALENQYKDKTRLKYSVHQRNLLIHHRRVWPSANGSVCTVRKELRCVVFVSKCCLFRFFLFNYHYANSAFLTLFSFICYNSSVSS